MTDKVVPLKPGMATETNAPQPELATLLRDLADRADRGDLQTFVGFGFNAEDTRVAIWYLPTNHDTYAMLGGITWLQHEYIDKVTTYEE